MDSSQEIWACLEMLSLNYSMKIQSRRTSFLQSLLEYFCFRVCIIIGYPTQVVNWSDRKFVNSDLHVPFVVVYSWTKSGQHQIRNFLLNSQQTIKWIGVCGSKNDIPIFDVFLSFQDMGRCHTLINCKCYLYRSMVTRWVIYLDSKAPSVY